MAIFRKTSAREMKFRMIICSAFFFVVMAITSWMGVQGTTMIFFVFGVLGVALAVYWARREARERNAD